MENGGEKAKRLDPATLVMCLLFALSVLLFRATGKGRPDWLAEPLYVFLRMASIVGMIGIVAWFVGEAVPRSIYHPERFPFKPFAWEQNGRVYEALGVKWRKNHAIDMSRFMPRAFPKQNTLTRDPARLRRLLQEMCNAEAVHWVLALLSPVFAWLIDGWYGVAIAVGYALSNLSDVMIQRYNRPRIMMILERLER